MTTKVSKNSIIISADYIRDCIIVYLTTTYLLAFSSIILTIGISKYLLSVSLFVSLAVVAVISSPKLNIKSFLIAILFLAVYTGACISITTFFVDHFWDSRVYHGPAIMAIVDGWNPYLDTFLCDWSEYYCTLANEKYHFILSDYYPKSQWYVSATFYSVFGNIDSGKVINYLILAALLITSYLFSKRVIKHHLDSILFSLAISLNPVLLAQLNSGYIDGILASVLSLIIILLLEYIIYESRRSLYLALILFPYLINLKFTGIVYVGVICAGLSIYIYIFYLEKLKYFLGTVVIMSFISITVFGFNPYFTNYEFKGNPFYPALNVSTGEDILSDQADITFINKNRFQKFIISCFSVEKSPEKWKEPVFSFPLSNFSTDSDVATRFSGFGPIFSTILIFYCIQIILMLRSRMAPLSLIIFFSAFASSAVWWARLAPQVWLAISLLQLAFLTHEQSLFRGFGRVMLIILITNSIVVFWQKVKYHYEYATVYHDDINYLKENSTIPPLQIDGSWFYGGYGDFSIYNKRKIEDDLGKEIRELGKCLHYHENKFFQICE